MSGPQGALWKLTIRGGIESDLKKLLGQDKVNDLRACMDCKEQISTLAQKMNSEVKDVLLDAESKLNQLSETVDEDQRELAKVCVAMGLNGGSTQVTPDSGHAIVGEELARYLPQLISDVKLRKNELLVSPDFLPLVERLLAKRLSGRRQPKVSEKVEVWPGDHLRRPDAMEHSMLSEQEREDILSKFEFGRGLALSQAQRERVRKEQREHLREILLRPPEETAEIEAVSLISFQSQKTKSTGIGAKYKFKIKMISMPKALHGGKSSSSEPGLAGDGKHDEIPHCRMPVIDNFGGAMSETSLSLSFSIFEACAEKLQHEYNVEITGQQLHDLFQTCCGLISNAAIVETESVCGSDSDNVVDEKAHDDNPCLLLEIIKALEADNTPAPRSFGSFQKYCLASVHGFSQDVIMPYLEKAPDPVKFEGSEIPMEAVAAIQAKLSDIVTTCFTEQILTLYFIGRKNDADQCYRRMSRRIIKRSLQTLLPSLKHGLVVNAAGTSWTLSSMKQALSREAECALERAVKPLLEEAWTSVHSTRTSSTSVLEPSDPQVSKIFRSRRIRQNEAQTFATWMHRTSHRTEKKMTFLLKR